MASKGRNLEIHTNGSIDNNSALNLRNCFVCNTLCNSTCGRCGEFYCSKKCQSADWRDHRFVCFKMPNLVMGSALPNNQQSRSNARAQIEEKCDRPIQNGFNKNASSTLSLSAPTTTSTTELQQKKISFAQAPSNNDDVILAYAKCANTFYIRTCSGNDEYIKDSKLFDQNGKNGKKILQMPSKNDVVFVRHKGAFFRGIVIKPVAEDNIEVALCDIGNTLTKSLYEIREITDELYDRKRYNFKLTLEYLPSAVGKLEWEKLMDFVNNGTVFTLQFDGDDWATGKNFKLMEKGSGQPIEALLFPNKVGNCDKKHMSASSPPKVEKSIESLEVVENKNQMKNSKSTRAKKVTLEDFTYESLPEVADLIVVDNSTICMGSVSVILHENLEIFTELHNKIQLIGNDLNEKYEPEPDEMCLAKFGDDWYRALYAPPNCVLIDYGNSETIDKNDIRKFPLELMDPCYTNFCYVQNFTSQSVQNIKHKLEKLLNLYSVHKKCICSTGNNEPNEYDVTFPLILEYLEEGDE